jgi:hypothetical protein
MGKRAKWLDEELPDYLKDYKGPVASDFLSFEDNHPWQRPVSNRNEIWFEALVAIDKRGDKAPLIALLRTEDFPHAMHKFLVDLMERYRVPFLALLSALTPDTQNLLADLLEQYPFKRKRGAQPTPLYDLPPAEAVLWPACAAVRALVKAGMRVSSAVDRIGAEHHIPPDILYASYMDTRGGSHRARAHLKKTGRSV